MEFAVKVICLCINYTMLKIKRVILRNTYDEIRDILNHLEDGNLFIPILGCFFKLTIGKFRSLGLYHPLVKEKKTKV